MKTSLLQLVASLGLALLIAQHVHLTRGAPTTTTTTSTSTSTTSAPVVTTEEEPMTSTGDSLSVNADETFSAAGNTPVNLDEEAGESEPEGRSIVAVDQAAGGPNSLDKSAKLSNDKAQAASDSSWASKPRAVSHLNMSQVDELYLTAHKDDEETVKMWKQLGDKLKKGVTGLIGGVVPFALNISQEAKISSECSGNMLKWVLGMSKLRSWALKLIDASGKPVAGMMEGSMTMFGNYRQCLATRAPDEDEIEEAGGEFRESFRGKYCIIQAKPWLPQKKPFYNLNTKFKPLMDLTVEDPDEPRKWYEKTVVEELSEWALSFNFVNIRYDLCVPSHCSREDIQKVINFLLRDVQLKARVLRCEMESPDDSKLGAASEVETGSAETLLALAATEQSNHMGARWPNQLAWLLVPLVAVAVVLMATCLSYALEKRRPRDKLSPSNSQQALNRFQRAVYSVSLNRSLGGHLRVDYDQLADDKPLALYGIRFIIVMWIVLVESAINLKFEYLRELLVLKELVFWWPMQVIVNSTLQFDSIILLTAFTMAYKNCLNDNIHRATCMARFVIDKYVRLMPSIMLMVALVVLLPLANRGPVWNDYVAHQSAVCQSSGWLNTVFLQNYLPFKEICLPQTWVLCVELQLVILMAPIVYQLNKCYESSWSLAKTASGPAGRSSNTPLFWASTTPGRLLLGCVIIGLAGSFYNVLANELPPSWLYTMADPDSKALYFGQHLTKLWTHLAVFAIGLLAGVECRRAWRDTMSRPAPNQRYLGGLLLGAASMPSLSQPGKTSAGELAGALSSVSINLGAISASSDETINRSLHSAGPNQSGQAQKGLWARRLAHLWALLVALAIMGTLIFSTHDWSLNELPSAHVAALYDVMSRLLWSAALSWLLYLVSVPDGDSRRLTWTARQLGRPMLVSLGKLSFLIYLIHPYVHTAVLAIQEQPIYSSWLMLFHVQLGNITITVILAALVSVFVELPCRNLFRRCGTSLLLAESASSGAGTSRTGGSSLAGSGLVAT